MNEGATRPEAGTLFLTLGAPFYRFEGALWVEDQTITGLHSWAAHFARIIAPSISHHAPPPAGWSRMEPDKDVFEMIELPDGYHLPTYLRQGRDVADRLTRAMARADYRLFAIGGWIGDWGVTGAAQARRMGLSHGVWFDRVESQVLFRTSGQGLRARIKARIKHAIVSRAERRALQGADLGLLHGRTVLDELGRYSRNPHIVEDILTDRRIAPDALEGKLAQARSDAPLRVVYAGRADAMKGPLDWISALAGARDAGARLQADWLGDGQMLDEMRRAAVAAGLDDAVTFHGFVTDADKVTAQLTQAHVLLFCHLTDESPRVLIEALHAGTPLLGYADPYAESLVEERGAGSLVPRGDVGGLVGMLVRLASEPALRADLIARAAASSHHLTREAVFAHRSAIVKTHLAPP